MSATVKSATTGALRPGLLWILIPRSAAAAESMFWVPLRTVAMKARDGSSAISSRETGKNSVTIPVICWRAGPMSASNWAWSV